MGQISWESGGWDPGCEGQKDPNDRGLAQINAKAFPDIPDAVAYDPFFAIARLCKQLRDGRNKYGKWSMAICLNKGPSAVEEWHRTGVVPVDSNGDSYLEYVKLITDRAALEAKP
jgi:hypothetical protein